MKFYREITHEEMSKIAQDPRVVYVLTSATNDHGLVNKNLFRLTPTSVNVDGIAVDPKTGEWSFKLRKKVYEDYTIYPTLADVNNYIKSVSKFWEVGAYNEVIGWNMPESVVLEAKHNTEQVGFFRLCFKGNPPSKDWEDIVFAAKRELEFLDKDNYAVFTKEIEDFESRAREYYKNKP